MKKNLIILLGAVLIFTSIGVSAAGTNTVQAVVNSINIELNGVAVDGNNLLYDGTTYVPLKIMAEMVGGTVGWNGDTRTASVSLSSGSATPPANTNQELSIRITDYNNPIIPYDKFGISFSDIYGIAFQGVEQPIQYSLQKDGLHWEQVLEPNTTQELTILLKSGNTVKATVSASGLQSLKQKEEAYVVFVPAQPDLGFNFPYMLRVPGKNEKPQETDNTYLVVDSSNGFFTLDDGYSYVHDTLSNCSQISIEVARDFGYPAIMPIFHGQAFGLKWMVLVPLICMNMHLIGIPYMFAS